MLQNWFPTPIWVHKFSGNDLNKIQTEILNVINTIKQGDLSNPWSDTVKTSFKYAYDDASISNDLKKYNLAFTKSKIVEQLNYYCQCVNHDLQSEIKESWFNFSNRGNFQFDHQHGSCNISGCYYFKTNGDDGDITFSNPNLIAFRRDIFPSLYYKEQLNVIPSEGLLLIFPSWLTHRVNVNNTNNERISLSFNI
jgi:uncharacterized protein (TIGR02466 family)